MKKLISIVGLLFCAGYSFAQEIVNNQSVSNVATIYRIKGATKPERAFILPVTSDTLLNGIDSVGMMIYVNQGVNRGIWYRDSTEIDDGTGDLIPTKIWRQFRVGQDTVYVADDLYVLIDSAGHQVIHRLRNDGLISGGIVTWTGVGLTFAISPAVYILSGIEYRTLADTITLDSAHVSLGRIDAFIVDTIPDIGKITGTASATPATPQEEPISQIVLAYILINAGDTIPTSIISQIIYNENIGSEWLHTTAGTLTADFDNTDYPAVGAKSIYVSSYENNSKIYFAYSDSAEDGTLGVDSNVVLSMYLSSVGLWPVNNRLHFRFFLDDRPVTVNHVTLGAAGNQHGFNSQNGDIYQIVAIPLTAWNWTDAYLRAEDQGQPPAFNRVVMTMTGTDNAGTKGYYLDMVQLQKGAIIVPPPNDNSNKVDSVTIIAGSDYYWIKGIRHLIGTRGGTYTADNGLTMAANNVKLGGTLLANTTIDNGSGTFRLNIQGTTNTQLLRLDQAGTGGGIFINQTTTGAAGTSFAITTASSNATPIQTIGQQPSLFNIRTTGTNNVAYPLNLARMITSGSGSAAAGVGVGLNFYGLPAVGDRTLGIESVVTDVSVPGKKASMDIYLADDVPSVEALRARLYSTGAWQWPAYGIGTFVTGTPAYNLVVDASGNIIESATPFGGTVYTADNGLTMAANNAQLGGSALLANTDILTSAFNLDILSSNTSFTFRSSSSSASGIALYGVSSASGTGVVGEATTGSGVGVRGNGASIGLWGISEGAGIETQTTNGLPAFFTAQPASTNTIVPMISMSRATSGTAANGIGGSITFYSETAGGSSRNSTNLTSKWTDVTDVSRVSQFIIEGVNSAVTGDIATFDGTGVVGIGIGSSFTGTRLNAVDNSLAGSSMVSYTSTSTAAAGNVQKLLNVSLSGGNATASQTTYGVYVENIHTGTSSTNYAIRGTASGGTFNRGIRGDGTSVGVHGFSSGEFGTGVQASAQGASGYGLTVDASSTATGASIVSTEGLPLRLQMIPASTNTVVEMLGIFRSASSAGANGIGGSIGFYPYTSTSTANALSNQLISKWTDATHASRTSQFIITGVNSAVTQNIFTISGDGRLLLDQYSTLPTYADEAAAVTGGLLTNQIYKTATGEIRIKL